MKKRPAGKKRDPLFWRRYSIYLKSDEWKILRGLALAAAGNRCSVCKCSENLEVHHLTYERVFKERLSDLTVLCHFHHELAHGRKLGRKKK